MCTGGKHRDLERESLNWRNSLHHPLHGLALFPRCNDTVRRCLGLAGTKTKITISSPSLARDGWSIEERHRWIEGDDGIGGHRASDL